MENNRLHQGKRPELASIANVLDDGREIGFQAVEAFGDVVEALFEAVQARPQGVGRVGKGLVELRRPSVVEHGVEVLRVPAQGRGQGFQGPRAAAAFDGAVLDLADDRLRDVRALGEFSLTPPQLIHALVDGLGDCRPILRHVFLRAPPQR